MVIFHHLVLGDPCVGEASSLALDHQDVCIAKSHEVGVDHLVGLEKLKACWGDLVVGGRLGVGVDQALLTCLVLGLQVITHGGPITVAFCELKHGCIT